MGWVDWQHFCFSQLETSGYSRRDGIQLKKTLHGLALIVTVHRVAKSDALQTI